MSEQQTGGPAFPVDEVVIDSLLTNASQGMTLRDYFAAKAMQGFAATACCWDDGVKGMAQCAYEWADAMLEARK